MVGSLFGLSAGTVASAAAAPRTDAAHVRADETPRPCPPEPATLNQALLDCLVDRAKGAGDKGTAVFHTPPAMAADDVPEDQLQAAAKAFAEGRLTVVLPAGEAGQGGAILLVLASDRDHRLVSPESQVPRLGDAASGPLANIGRCGDGSLCAALGDKAVRGSDLIRDRQAVDSGTPIAPVVRGRDTGSGTPLWQILLLAAVAVLLLALAVPYG
ncbi:MAG: hypothetical protein HOV68_29895, partial [Streptomycetaceae bacterium]|nr:hypothetical protein [Streptomycetaceae bacterium]